MKKVVVAWDDQRDAAAFSVELSRWCQSQGLINSIDYNWHFIPDAKQSVFYFGEHCESYATLFALKWAGNEV